MKLNAFGRMLVVLRRDDEWKVMDQGNEGKRRAARDIVIPTAVSEEEVVEYISDLLHEYASERFPTVEIIE